MKIINHGNSIIFKCADCGCEFSELPKQCYSSTGEDGAHYMLSCPECGNVCYTTDALQETGDAT